MIRGIISRVDTAEVNEVPFCFKPRLEPGYFRSHSADSAAALGYFRRDSANPAYVSRALLLNRTECVEGKVSPPLIVGFFRQRSVARALTESGGVRAKVSPPLIVGLFRQRLVAACWSA